ncbi:MAG: HlyD family efflux transporter periplasmic adaptor subunit [Nitrospirota bacterium]|nr:HlyD family efflux transporter periplasmic adaptor subunit [Nitrospirota bacterium]
MRYIAFFLMFVLFCPAVTVAGVDSKDISVPAENRLLVRRASKDIRLIGYTRKERSMTVSSEVPGRVFSVNYDVGQAVGKKPFIEIEPTFIDLEIEKTEQFIKKLDIALKRMQVRVAYLEKEFLRVDTLYRRERATGVKRDAAAQELEQARLELDSTVQERAVQKTVLRELSERKLRHNIYAPGGWIVTKRMVEPGEVIQPGTPLAEVSDYSGLVVPFSLSSEELSAIESLTEEFDAELEGVPVKASLKWINPEFDEKTRKLNVELVIRDFRGQGRGGLMFVLPLQIRSEGLFIPKPAVTSRYENPTVTVKETGEVVKLTPLGEFGDYLRVAADERLVPGTELFAAGQR